MPVSKNRQFAKIANDVAADGTLTADGISSDVTLGGATIYATRSVLPVSGNTAGDQAYVTGNNRLYIWNGSGWYNVALLNLAPSITSVQDSDGNTTPFTLATDGTATTITITATDSDGDPITYTAASDSDFAGLATLSQDSSVFTITPFSQDSATTESGTITFTATDGVNVASSGVQTFTLNFVSAFWDETVLSIGTSSTNSLDNSTFIDRSSNAHSITANGNTKQTAFHPYLDNWSVEFDGNGDYLYPDSTSSSFAFGTNDFTIEMWIKLQNLSANNIVYDGRPSNTSGNYITWFVSTTGVLTFYVNNAVRISSSASDISINTWHHIAVSRSGSSTKMFIDGTQVGSTYSDSTNYLSAAERPFIGSNSYAVSSYVFGYISNVRIVDGTAVYTSAFTPPTEKLTAISGTSLLTCQSNRFIDNSTNAHTITTNGNVAVSAYNPFGQESEYAAGENKGSGYFDGSGDYLSTPSDATLGFGTGDFTCEFWYYHVSRASTDTMLAPSTSNLNVYINTSGTLGYYDGSARNSSQTVPLNTWSHIAVVRSSSTIKMYYNGTEVLSQANSVNYATTSWLIGVNNTSGSDWSHGYISDLRIVKGTAVYTSAFTPPTAPVGNSSASLYLPMDNAGIFDKTGNNTLTPVGNASTSTTQTKFADTAMYFDGNVDRIEKLGGIDVNMSSFTIEGWIYPTSWTAGVATSMFAFNGSSDGSNVLVYTANGLYYGSGASDYWTGTGLSTNEWSHVAVTYDGTTVKAYENGTEVLSQSHTFSANFSDCDFVLGSEFDAANGGTPGNYLTGYIENFQIISGVVKYTTNFTPPTSTQGRTYQAES